MATLAEPASAETKPPVHRRWEHKLMKSRQEIMARAADDPQFRAQLKSDPKGTLERELGGSMPGDVRINVLEETPEQVYLVLPTPGSKELNADELAGVAGGGCWIGTSAGCSFVTTS
jgi:hypothetical protein